MAPRPAATEAELHWAELRWEEEATEVAPRPAATGAELRWAAVTAAALLRLAVTDRRRVRHQPSAS